MKGRPTGSVSESRKMVRSLVKKIPEEILKQTKLKGKIVTFIEDMEVLEPNLESREPRVLMEKKDPEISSGESEDSDFDGEPSEKYANNIYTVLAWTKLRNEDRELQTDLSSGT